LKAEIERLRREEEAEDGVQSPKSEVQSLGTGNGAEVRNTGLESPVNSQTGKSALQEADEPGYVPNPDPEKEAYIQWWLMNQNIKPFDYEKLQRLYAAIPKKAARRSEPETEPEYFI
jgi:hypothetical protein